MRKIIRWLIPLAALAALALASAAPATAASHARTSGPVPSGMPAPRTGPASSGCDSGYGYLLIGDGTGDGITANGPGTPLVIANGLGDCWIFNNSVGGSFFEISNRLGNCLGWNASKGLVYMESASVCSTRYSWEEWGTAAGCPGDCWAFESDYTRGDYMTVVPPYALLIGSRFTIEKWGGWAPQNEFLYEA